MSADADDLIEADADEESSSPMPNRRTLVAGLAAGLVVLAGVFVAMFAPDETADPTASSGAPPFIGSVAAVLGEAWWGAAGAGDRELLAVWTHPDSPLDLAVVSSVAPDPEADISFDQVPFGTLDQPQLCYVFRTSGVPEYGSMVFQFTGAQWLVWDIRPGVETCAPAS